MRSHQNGKQHFQTDNQAPLNKRKDVAWNITPSAMCGLEILYLPKRTNTSTKLENKKRYSFAMPQKELVKLLVLLPKVGKDSTRKAHHSVIITKNGILFLFYKPNGWIRLPNMAADTYEYLRLALIHVVNASKVHDSNGYLIVIEDSTLLRPRSQDLDYVRLYNNFDADDREA